MKPNYSRSLSVEARRFAVACFCLAAASAHAQQMIGQSLLNWANPIIMFLGAGAVIVALLGSVFNPMMLKGGIYAALILTVVFFLIHNLSAFQSAVSNP